MSAPADGATNMAVDHSLMRRARATGEGVLRVYSWSSPVLTFGRNQLAVGQYDDRAMRDRGIACVRRPTGGRALLHHREVTYSVTRPATDDTSLAATYADINNLLVDALAALGVGAGLAPKSPARAPNGVPCFAEPSRGEIVVGGKKLAGSAQWRDGGVLLQHGSILLDDDQSLIGSLLREPATAATAAPSPATLNGILGRQMAMPEVALALFEALRRIASVDGELEDAPPPQDLLSFYRDSSWTWRR